MFIYSICYFNFSYDSFVNIFCIFIVRSWIFILFVWFFFLSTFESEDKLKCIWLHLFRVFVACRSLRSLRLVCAVLKLSHSRVIWFGYLHMIGHWRTSKQMCNDERVRLFEIYIKIVYFSQFITICQIHIVGVLVAAVFPHTERLFHNFV